MTPKQEADSASPGSSLRPGASGEEEDEDMALDGEEGNAGPEEERLDGPEGECTARGIAGLAGPRVIALPAGPGLACRPYFKMLPSSQQEGSAP